MAKETAADALTKVEQIERILVEDIDLFMKYNKMVRLVKTSIPKVIHATGSPTYHAIRKQKGQDPKTHQDMMAFFNHCRELARQQDKQNDK